MELEKKTTILFPSELHRRLVRVAKEKHTSVGHLVRTACEVVYGLADGQDRLAHVAALGALELPAGEPFDLKRESVPPAKGDKPRPA